MEIVTALSAWAARHSLLLWGLSAVSLIAFIGTIAMLPFFISRIPDDYFLHSARRSSRHCRTSPGRLLYLVVKNIVGIVFIIAGIIMLFIPGQGILTILIGVMLMNFPKKRLLALRLIRQPSVLKAVNWMRSRSRRPPLILPDTDSM